jgi:hypothetical protein
MSFVYLWPAKCLDDHDARRRPLGHPPDWADHERRPLRNTYRQDTSAMHHLGTQVRLHLDPLCDNRPITDQPPSDRPVVDPPPSDRLSDPGP